MVKLRDAGYNWVYGGDIRVSGMVLSAVSILIDDDQLYEVLAVLKSQITFFWDLRACSLMGTGRNRVLRKGFFFSWRDSPLLSLGVLLVHEDFCGFQITHNDTPQSVGLLWTSDQLVAEIST